MAASELMSVSPQGLPFIFEQKIDNPVIITCPDCDSECTNQETIRRCIDQWRQYFNTERVMVEDWCILNCPDNDCDTYAIAPYYHQHNGCLENYTHIYRCRDIKKKDKPILSVGESFGLLLMFLFAIMTVFAFISASS